jgi:hypothetical protein
MGMTDEELLKELRYKIQRESSGDTAAAFSKKWEEPRNPHGDAAADRIEQLVATNEQLVRERDDYAYKLIESNNTYTEMHITIEQLQAKLSKAMVGLRSYMSKEKGVWGTADALLAELEKTE